MSEASCFASQSRLHFNGALKRRDSSVAQPLLRSWLSLFQLFPVFAFVPPDLSCSPAAKNFKKDELREERGKGGGEREGGREGWGAEGKVKDKAWEEVKRGNHIFGHRLRRGERGSRSAEGEGRGQVKVREFDGDPAGWVFIFLLILLRCSLPWRIVVEMDFGAAASNPCGPSFHLPLSPSLPGPRVER